MKDLSRNNYFSKYNLLEVIILAIFILSKWAVGTSYAPSSEIVDVFILSSIIFVMNLIGIKSCNPDVKLQKYDFIAYALFCLQLAFMTYDFILSTDIILLLFRVIFVLQVILFVLLGFLRRNKTNS